ncbi:membrane-bound lytic murein transglycosylase MltF [Propionivibrio sp.]|uniref:membrane-bound lytic murein transglycosylase MltF n=1 Tax=Propionivibrio sp. TaxID=2212460 RepID=UPI0025F4AB24|nr:membrane-bound lytic murein transglycosylase MltF [Propionivibrio sp.]MBK8745222.1 membrane-bound lytic murein transglycosylase MltF [Propionivibrio sp.]MBK8893969.1 membrane-bound lytic murein transglycosylase MltF [Propionivibrio sp.]
MRLILLALVVIIAGCSEQVQLPLAKTRELVILTRVGSTSYSVNETNGASGFDYDLVRLFAKDLGLKARIVVAASDNDILQRVKSGEAHLAAAWQSPVADPAIHYSTPYFQDHDILVTHEAALPLTSIEQLANKTVHVVAGSRQETALRESGKSVPGLLIVGSHKHSELDLLEGVANQRFEATLVNGAAYDIGKNYYPELQYSLELGEARPIVWLFSPGVDPELIAKANAFLERLHRSGEMDRLKDRYFGHVERLTQADSMHFIERMHSVLDTYRPLFQAAQTRTGIDWRLLAAVAYQESQWDPWATSPTGVRGMMMLTEDTADLLGVGNRLDAAQSINAGAQYISDLRDALPNSIAEPDRLWLTLAAYNLGMGHLNAARYLAKTLQANPDSWYAMKKILPLLGLPQYYSRLKSGKGRGGEAVIMVENIRLYKDILDRYERPYDPLEKDSVKSRGRQEAYSKQDARPKSRQRFTFAS